MGIKEAVRVFRQRGVMVIKKGKSDIWWLDSRREVSSRELIIMAHNVRYKGADVTAVS